jgi:hypothetical protein
MWPAVVAAALQDPVTQQQMLGMMPMGMLGPDQLQVSLTNVFTYTFNSSCRHHGAFSEPQQHLEQQLLRMLGPDQLQVSLANITEYKSNSLCRHHGPCRSHSSSVDSSSCVGHAGV